MTNQHRGEVPVEMNGEVYVLHFSLNRIAEVCELLDCNVAQIHTRVDESTMREFLGVIALGLQDKHPGITGDQIGEMEFDTNAVSMATGMALAIALRGGNRADPEVLAKMNEYQEKVKNLTRRLTNSPSPESKSPPQKQD